MCGGGPAGLGPLVAATKRGEIGRVLDMGVLVVEQTNRVGGGAIGHYRLRGNSFANAFLESLETTADDGLLDGVRGAAATRGLMRIGGDVPPLSLVGDYLYAIGDTLHAALETSPASGVALRTRVACVRLLPGDGVSVGLEPEKGPRREITARRALLTLGGQPPARMLDTEILPGIVLRNYAKKVVHSSVIVEGRAYQLSSPPRSRRDLRVAVIGGSHSAWSVAWALAHQPDVEGPRSGLGRVQVLHRNPVRLFYLSAAEAIRDGYDFDPVADVCPLSGRVHRFSGLRGDARDLARQAFGLAPGGRASSVVSCLAIGEAKREEVAAALEGADLVVAGVGYDARLPELLGADGQRLQLSRREVGLQVSSAGEILDIHGRPIPALLAYGLGAGFAPSSTVGGEPSASTRADGVWLYHHDVGAVVLDRILQRDREQLAGAR